MRIRGRRECRGCGARWSYYETGRVTCPECASVESRGLDEQRQLHTASPATLDLSAVRSAVEERPLEELTADAKAACREYVREQGFLRGGELLALSDVYLAAKEIVYVADVAARTLERSDAEELYLLDLLAGADRGERPAPEELPESLRAARGLAVAEAVREYRRDLRTWLDEHPDPEARSLLGAVAEHDKRLRALQGDVPVASAEQLLAAVRDVGTALRMGDETALATARERLDRLEDLENG